MVKCPLPSWCQVNNLPNLLYFVGAHVIVGCKNEDKMTEELELMKSLSKTKLDVIVKHLDLASFKSIREFAEKINSGMD